MSTNLELNPKRRTIFVSGLSYSTTESELREFFKDCGEIELIKLPRYWSQLVTKIFLCTFRDCSIFLINFSKFIRGKSISWYECAFGAGNHWLWSILQDYDSILVNREWFSHKNRWKIEDLRKFFIKIDQALIAQYYKNLSYLLRAIQRKREKHWILPHHLWNCPS